MVSFYLMGSKGYRVLEKVLAQFGRDFIGYVVSGHDSGVQKDWYNEMKTLCTTQGIAFFNQKDTVPRSDHFRIAIGWKWLIHDSNGLIVLHDSLLPRYRGFNPLVTALLEGDEEIGATAIWANKEADKGDIITSVSRKIQYPLTIEDATELVTGCYEEICSSICEALRANEPLPAVQQDEQNASYSLWRDEMDYAIDWNRDAAYIRRFIDAHGFPYKCASSIVKDQLIRIKKADTADDIYIVNRTPGKVFKIENELVYVVCGKGMLAIREMEVDQTGLRFIPATVRSRFL